VIPLSKRILGVSIVVAFLGILWVQSVTAAAPAVYVWTDRSQYNRGETGVLKISVLNLEGGPIEIHNITIIYPWHAYDAKKGEWVGNETLEGKPLATMNSMGTENDHYYKEVEFTIPTDGRAAQLLTAGTINIGIVTSDGVVYKTASLLVSGVSLPVSIVALDTWMTSLIVALIVSIIILAIVVILSRRKARSSSALVTRAPALPPMSPSKPTPKPKPKAKTE
jgi:hypothetical protein